METQIEKIHQRQCRIAMRNAELQRMIYELNHDICTLNDINKVEMRRNINYGRSTGSNRNR